jgi:hypothetical protein
VNLPRTNNPQAYTGSYVLDLDGHVAMGYSAEQVAVILQSERFAGAVIYKIVRAYPDGRMEIHGVDRSRFRAEDGLFFHHAQLEPARADFELLKGAARQLPPPCRAVWQLAKRPGEPLRYLTALIFPAESADEIAEWLKTIHFEGGQEVVGGVSEVIRYHQQADVLQRQQLWPAGQTTPQTADEALANPKVQAG